MRFLSSMAGSDWMTFQHHDYAERHADLLTLKTTSATWKVIDHYGRRLHSGTCASLEGGMAQADAAIRKPVEPGTPRSRQL